MSRTLWLGTALALVAGTAQAADSQGRYAAHGIGRTSCQRFVEVCEKGADECKLTATYISGYVTAFNALNKDTFDILPWQRPELVAEGAFNLCRRNPKVALIEAVNEVVRVLLPQRIEAAAERTQIGEGNQAVYLYKATIRDLQQKLIDTGHLKGKADGAFGPGTRSALEAFQKSVGLPGTGVPDQPTLIALFYGVGRPGQSGAAAPTAPTAPAPGAPVSDAPSAAPPAASAGPAATAREPTGLDLNLAPGGLSGGRPGG